MSIWLIIYLIGLVPAAAIGICVAWIVFALESTMDGIKIILLTALLIAVYPLTLLFLLLEQVFRK